MSQGMLGIGAAMLGSFHVIGIDVDEDALQTAQENCKQYEDLQVGVMAVNLVFAYHGIMPSNLSNFDCHKNIVQVIWN